MPQGIPLMATFVGAMLLGAVPAILAYPNFKVEPSKYRFGLAGVTANLHAKVVVIDNEFPDDLLGHVTLGEAQLLRAADASAFGGDGGIARSWKSSPTRSRSFSTPPELPDCRREWR